MIARVPGHATKSDLVRVARANPLWKVELDADGTLRMTPPAGFGSGRRNLRLGTILAAWADVHGYVAADSSTGYEFADGTIVSPDASLVRRERVDALTDEQHESFAPLVPDIAVELVSKTDAPSELKAKLLDLRRRGTTYVVLVDPYRQSLWSDGDAPPDFPDLRDVLKLR